MTAQNLTRFPDDPRDAAYLAILAVIPMLGYQFGVGNQVEQFAIIKRMLDPSFAAGDFFLDSAAGFGPRFYYSAFLAALTGLFPLPTVVLVLSILCNFATAGATYLSARRLLGADALAGAIAATLAVANSGFSLGLAGFIRFDSFQPANIAIPFSLFGFYFALSGRLLLAAPIFALSSLFHPLIGVETGLIAYGANFLATLFRRRGEALRLPALGRQSLAGCVFLALVFLAWGAPALSAASEKMPDAEFFDTLIAFRAPHHYLALTFPRAHYLGFGLFCLGCAIVVGRYAAARGIGEEAFGLLIAAGAVIAACAASVIFVDLLESRLYATAQVFRLLYLVKWIGYLFIGWLLARWMNEGAVAGTLYALLAVTATGEAMSIVLLLCLGARWLAERAAFPAYAAWAIAAGAALAVAFIDRKFSYGFEQMRLFVASLSLLLIYKSALAPAARIWAGLGATAAFLLFAVVNKDARWIDVKTFRPTFAWSDLQGPDVDIARWARASPPSCATWAAPPEFETFRLIAGRAVVADFTSIPFDDSAMRAWKDRMLTLYGPVEAAGFQALLEMQQNYRGILREELRKRAEKFGAHCAVLYASTPWTGPVLYQNEAYKAVLLAPPGEAADGGA